MEWFPNYNYILASKSPRRQQLLESLGIPFTVKTYDIEENYPNNLAKEEIPVYLSVLKTEPFKKELKDRDLLITADTIVWLNGKVLGKPADENEAILMLKELSGKEHQVISGVSLTSVSKQVSFHSLSNVHFKKLSEKEINFYINHSNPFDKAGSYGIQDWIGIIGIISIRGSFYNVMGLPIQKLYEEILQF
jgi:septum formation protein